MSDAPRCAMLLTPSMQSQCFSPADRLRIASATDFVAVPSEDLTDALQADLIRNADIIVTGWGTRPLTAAMLDAAPGLKLMCHAAGSVKHLIGDDFAQRGIRISSAAAALAVGVAEFAFGMMLVSMKAAWQYNDLTRQGVWLREPAFDWVREPHGATVGIVGASRVGCEMIRLCRSLSLEAILVFDPYLGDDEARAMGAVKTDLDDLMRRSDVVSLHTPAVEACRHIVNARNLALMKDRAIFINTARGMCVDEAALIDELSRGRLFACLDVTSPEPPEPGSPLYTLPNCILTPHIAGSIKENTRRQGHQVADQIEAFLAGRPVPGEFDTAALDRLA